LLLGVEGGPSGSERRRHAGGGALGGLNLKYTQTSLQGKLTTTKELVEEKGNVG